MSYHLFTSPSRLCGSALKIAVWLKMFSFGKVCMTFDRLVFSRTALLNMRENREEIIMENIHSTKIAKFPTAGFCF
jgi:hypothetical protein